MRTVTLTVTVRYLVVIFLVNVQENVSLERLQGSLHQENMGIVGQVITLNLTVNSHNETLNQYRPLCYLKVI